MFSISAATIASTLQVQKFVKDIAVNCTIRLCPKIASFLPISAELE
jgi:hypothetical protein